MDTTVFVVEQSPRYREWIVEAVEARRGLRLVGEGVDGHVALDDVKRIQPAVVTVAVRLPGLGGIEMIRMMITAGLQTRGLVIGSPLGVATIADALDAGAWGYVWKGQDPRVIADAIAAVGRGELFLGPRVQADLFESVRQRASGERVELTARETHVLALIADGRSTAEIAERLSMSIPTVKTHLRRTYAKLGVSDRAAAVAKAMRYGLLA
ncbi:MAG TPA: response regulator transcription factor [Dactylosporangium sp.]|nr:response regulator transcription factor [Dactylosporangium sp.]